MEYCNFVFDQNVSRHELACMIIVHEYPLSMVNHSRFRKFANSLQPLFNMVSRNTIKGDILKIYDSEKAKTSKFMEELNGRVAITSDMWTCNHSKKGFIAVTTHFIDDSWKLQRRISRFMYVLASHNKEILTEVLINTMLDWNIKRKLSTITLDNCTTNDAMIGSLLDKIDSSTLLLEGKVLYMRCCAHILNLIVKDGLEVMGDGIERIRDSVYFWIATPGRIEIFLESACQLKIPCNKKLCLDCKTRWNSTYLVLQVALIYKDVFPRLEIHERLYTEMPTIEDWEREKEICAKLKLFYSTTELFSGSNYPTSNGYFQKNFEIRVALSSWLESPLEIIRMVAAKMMVKFLKYWDVCYEVMAMAVVLNLRYKMKLVEYYFPKIYGGEALDKIEKVRQSCYDLVCEYQSKAISNVNSAGSSYSNIPSSVEDVNFEEDDDLSKFDLFVNMSSSNVPAKSELDFYLDENVLPRTATFDVLCWWKTNGIKFPTLQKIARDILAIPVSTVSFEAVFSPHRSRKHPTTLEALMCAQS
ncbi:zinc finger BED domain-containing protein RICESLEEPER 2-like [Cornus florida]|uniref:zinc finger BED domain-containing protein RICESLEEPER 2-like n=1 Tax=Cornus florida TaxID=4283 RepID=UPI00289CCB93|nr:zinc finger BED domain-containing protein RICESLEEPER 2-like [Cornus florida]